MEHFEKMGAFYLGRPYDLAAGQAREGYLLYDAKDLTTHGVCVGMTGSGKTGLCIAFLEEAAMDGIPAIVIDPKGDMANLLLSFPDLLPEDFRPWINEDDAVKKGLTADQFAAQQADFWRKGLAGWGQDGERIRLMREKTDFAVYTPGSTAGIPVSVLQSFSAPPPAVLDDMDLLQEQVGGTTGSLLSLIGLEADPIRSREHILIANLLMQVWQNGEDLDLARLIQLIQKPPFSQIGVMNLESFFPEKERFDLALQFNNLLASPGFASWMNGDPLDIDQALYTPAGKPKISIFSIAHLSDSERMFFVSMLLNKVVSWTRVQSGTTSLRAILYMDEIYGYFPPIANPPSKAPLLTLLKQARAYGLGVLLTSQNPVDLDYKGLANTGTWFIGRLQTERDKMRVLEGLEGAAVTQGASFDRGKMEQTLAGLGNRVFLMNNVHDDQPTLFETRWCMSYLRGPLTRSQIQKLHRSSLGTGGHPIVTQADAAAHADVPAVNEAVPAAKTAAHAATPGVMAAAPVVNAMPAPSSAASSRTATVGQSAGSMPVLPADIRQMFMPVRGSVGDPASIQYRPAVLGYARISLRDTKKGLSLDKDRISTTSVTDAVIPVDWEQAEDQQLDVNDLESSGIAGASYAELPAAAMELKSYTAWNRDFANWIYRTTQITLLQSPALKMTAGPDETERDFRIRMQQQARELRDIELEKLKRQYAVKIKSLEEKIRRSEQAVEREKEQARQQTSQTAISFGATLLSAFLGKKKISASSVGRATTAMRGVSRTMKEKGDINRSQDTVEAYKEQLKELEETLRIDTDALSERFDPMNQELAQTVLQPAKKDIAVRTFGLVWLPWRDQATGYEPAWK